MWVPFLSLLTKAALSTNSTAPWMEMSCIPGVQYAATGHKVSTWNIGLVQLRNRFQLYLIFIHLNEKKPYVGFVVDSADLWTRSLLTRREWPLPPGAALQTPLNTWWGFTCPPEGSGEGWLVPDLLQTPLPSSTPLLSALRGPRGHLVRAGMVGPTAVAESELQVGRS